MMSEKIILRSIHFRYNKKRRHFRPGTILSAVKDAAIRLQYSRARWYDPFIGRFISEDPIGFGGGDINLYGYVWNNPIAFTDPMGFDGWGNDLADELDENINYARDFYQVNPQYWGWNGTVDTVADLARGSADMLRVGDGLGHALYDEDENGYGRAAFVAMDVTRASSLFTALGYPGLRFARSPLGCRINAALYDLSGKELSFGPNFRIAPLGNRTGHPTGKFPHYHRRRFDSKGRVPRGQGLDRHRPWDTKADDKLFGNRF